MLRATLKSLLARKLRLTLSMIAVVLSVMFVAGSFVLTDTLGRSFDALFANIYTYTDVQVQPVAEERPAGQPGRPCRPSTVDGSRRVPGVAKATGQVFLNGAKVDRQERQARAQPERPALRRQLDRRGPADPAQGGHRAAVRRRGRDQRRPGQGRQLQARRPDRHHHDRAAQDLHGGRHLPVRRRPRVDGRRADRVLHREGRPAGDGRADRGLHATSTSRPRPAPPRPSCAMRSRPSSAATSR